MRGDGEEEVLGQWCEQGGEEVLGERSESDAGAPGIQMRAANCAGVRVQRSQARVWTENESPQARECMQGRKLLKGKPDARG